MARNQYSCARRLTLLALLVILYVNRCESGGLKHCEHQLLRESYSVSYNSLNITSRAGLRTLLYTSAIQPAEK